MPSVMERVKRIRSSAAVQPIREKILGLLQRRNEIGQPTSARHWHDGQEHPGPRVPRNLVEALELEHIDVVAPAPSGSHPRDSCW